MAHTFITVFISLMSFVFSLQAFMGKDIILDPRYTKASEEEREKMDKKAYRLQSAVIFLCVGAATLCNALRAITQLPLFTYLALAALIIGAVYAVVSHRAMK